MIDSQAQTMRNNALILSAYTKNQSDMYMRVINDLYQELLVSNARTGERLRIIVEIISNLIGLLITETGVDNVNPVYNKVMTSKTPDLDTYLQRYLQQ